ncbi:hypothetical protein [Nostoc sp.]|uniref:hypothetical protein n=1 Tax=Nostoc sp. TaxID=1180 RepID=UPI002FF460F1
MTTVRATQTATTLDRTHGLQTIQVFHRRSLHWKRSFALKSFSKNSRSPTPRLVGVGTPDESDSYPSTAQNEYRSWFDIHSGLFWLLIYSLSFDIVTLLQLATQTNKKYPIAKGQGAKGEGVAIIYFLQFPNNY